MYQQVIECGIEYRPFVRCASFHFHRTESFLPTLYSARAYNGESLGRIPSDTFEHLFLLRFQIIECIGFADE